MSSLIHPASFRDPSGFIFRGSDQALLRQVNHGYAPHYRLLMESGLYDALVQAGRLIDHEEEPADLGVTDEAFVVLRPRELPFISYPYEWSFSALKQAALLTLDVQLQALRAGMTLKDASAYNVQFEGARPVFIDTLSFEIYEEGAPWSAYGQFCRHFLAPLALMAKVDPYLGRLLTSYIDGVPLELASRLLPKATWLRPGLLMHLHAQARMTRAYSDTSQPHRAKKPARVSRDGLTALLTSLQNTVRRLSWNSGGTEWADYYDHTSYSSVAFDAKQQVVQSMLSRVAPQSVWDLGANTGVFSRLASRMGARTYSFDIDPSCVDRNFQRAQAEQDRFLLPLLLDLTNPSAALGWAHSERMSLEQRGPADVVMALALIHHLAISNNLPFARIAEYFAALGKHLIIEYVPKSDPQVQRLLSSRSDIFEGYLQERFEAELAPWYETLQQTPVGDDGRILYLMQSRSF